MEVKEFCEPITDRYGDALKEPEEKPTLAQSIQAWALLNENGVIICETVKHASITSKATAYDSIRNVNILIAAIAKITKENPWRFKKAVTVVNMPIGIQTDAHAESET